MAQTPYSPQFYRNHEDSVLAARAIIPHVLRYVQPRSVLDVGCGNGAFLSEFEAQAGADILGVDGDWVGADSRMIAPDRFRAANLEHPLRLDKRFALVVSLEVAEHLTPSSAEAFVESLTAHGDLVLFSAAVPGQGGTHHVNEQWPGYWVERFARHRYVPIDCLRRPLWDHPGAASWFWYPQNIVFYVKSERLADYPALARFASEWGTTHAAMVHPSLYARTVWNARRWDRIARLIPGPLRAAYRALRRRASAFR